MTTTTTITTDDKDGRNAPASADWSEWVVPRECTAPAQACIAYNALRHDRCGVPPSCMTVGELEAAVEREGPDVVFRYSDIHYFNVRYTLASQDETTSPLVDGQIGSGRRDANVVGIVIHGDESDRSRPARELIHEIRTRAGPEAAVCVNNAALIGARRPTEMRLDVIKGVRLWQTRSNPWHGLEEKLEEALRAVEDSGERGIRAADAMFRAVSAQHAAIFGQLPGGALEVLVLPRGYRGAERERAVALSKVHDAFALAIGCHDSNIVWHKEIARLLVAGILSADVCERDGASIKCYLFAPGISADDLASLYEEPAARLNRLAARLRGSATARTPNRPTSDASDGARSVAGGAETGAECATLSDRSPAATADSGEPASPVPAAPAVQSVSAGPQPGRDPSPVSTTHRRDHDAEEVTTGCLGRLRCAFLELEQSLSSNALTADWRAHHIGRHLWPPKCGLSDLVDVIIEFEAKGIEESAFRSYWKGSSTLRQEWPERVRKAADPTQSPQGLAYLLLQLAESLKREYQPAEDWAARLESLFHKRCTW